MILIPRNRAESDVATRWLKERLPDGFYCSDNCVNIVFYNDSKITAVLNLDEITRYNAVWSVASEDPRQWTKGLIRHLFDKYIWGPPLSLHRLTALVESTNKRSLRTTEAVGFKKEGELRELYGPGTTVILYGLLKSDFMEKWYEQRWRRSNLLP